MATVFFSLIVTLVTIVVSIGGLVLVRKRVHYSKLQMHHDVADPLLSVVGTLFAVLLGFMVANAMTRFEEARNTVQEEANAIANIYRTSMGLPKPVQENLQKSCEHYVDAAIDEWPLLSQKKTSNAVWQSYGEIWTIAVNLESDNNRISNLHQALMGYVGTLGNCRRMRIQAERNGLSPVLWGILLAGGLATISFTYFFGIEDFRLQVMMTSLVSVAICLNLFLLASYDDPFSGDVMVKPTPFLYDRHTFVTIKHPGTPLDDF